MKKTYLRLFGALILLLGLTTTFVSCSSDDDNMETIVKVKDLPEEAQTFLNTYFKGIEVQSVEKIMNGNVAVYEVNLSNGFEIVFNSEGEWQEVDAPDNLSVPMEIIPEQIRATLNEQYPGYGVSEINTSGQNYVVELSNNQGGPSINLVFNQAGEIVDTGNMG